MGCAARGAGHGSRPVDQGELDRGYREPLEMLPVNILTDKSGNKKDNITVIYTPWSNLKKDGSMAVGQVGFKDQRKVRVSTEPCITTTPLPLSTDSHPA